MSIIMRADFAGQILMRVVVVCRVIEVVAVFGEGGEWVRLKPVFEENVQGFEGGPIVAFRLGVGGVGEGMIVDWQERFCVDVCWLGVGFWWFGVEVGIMLWNGDERRVCESTW